MRLVHVAFTAAVAGLLAYGVVSFFNANVTEAVAKLVR